MQFNSYEPFGNQEVPFAEPQWYGGCATPYYRQTHVQWRAQVRRFVEEEVMPHAAEWDEAGTYPLELHRKAYEAGVYAFAYPEEYGGTPPPGSDGKPDAFHGLIFSDEMSRAAVGGLQASLWSHGIALPPLLLAGSAELKRRIVPSVINGSKIMALAVTEPWVGSDVANLRTTAKREGDFYVVNGQKKFITSGCRADYYTTAVRTGGEGHGGISLLLIPRKTPGIRVRKLKTQGWWSGNTAHITFEDVKVPASNLIGAENAGFLLIMHNFNGERFGICAMANRYSRVCLEDAIKYSRTRKTFGKAMKNHDLIRYKIGEMAQKVEACQAWIEQCAFQMDSGVAPQQLGAMLSLLKVAVTKTMEFCAREAAQVFGGNAYLRSGKGERVERLYREVRVVAIGGGSEEIMTLLATRLAKL